MPNLKSALSAQQSAASRHAAIKKSQEHRQTKASSIKASITGTKTASKRTRRAITNTSSTLPTSTPDSNDAPLGFKSKGKGKEKVSSRPATIPFARDDTILLLGEANFSFALAILKEPYSHPGHMLCATSYDSEEVCYQKYPDGEGNVAALREKSVKVGFGVDAGDLAGKGGRGIVGKGKRWSRVIFNFPHAGAGIKDQDRNVLSNQQLLLRTLRSVHPILTDGPPIILPTSTKKRKRNSEDAESEDEQPPTPPPELDEIAIPSTFNPPNRQGTLLITLLAQNPYTLWNLPKLATKPPPPPPSHSSSTKEKAQPKYTLLRSFKFKPEVYEGYAHRRTLGFKEGLSKGANEEIRGRKGVARTWEFVPLEEEEELGYEGRVRDKGWGGRI